MKNNAIASKIDPTTTIIFKVAFGAILARSQVVKSGHGVGVTHPSTKSQKKKKKN
jgi:hypothetical protein